MRIMVAAIAFLTLFTAFAVVAIIVGGHENGSSNSGEEKDSVKATRSPLPRGTFPPRTAGPVTRPRTPGLHTEPMRTEPTKRSTVRPRSGNFSDCFGALNALGSAYLPGLYEVRLLLPALIVSPLCTVSAGKVIIGSLGGSPDSLLVRSVEVRFQGQ